SPLDLVLGAQRVPPPSGGVSFEGWKGQLDEIDVFSRALSAAEIQSLYTSGGAVKSQSITAGPSVTPAALQSANRNVSTPLDLGSFTAPGADGPWTVSVNWGDSTSDSFTVTSAGPLGTRAHTYATKDLFTVTA